MRATPKSYQITQKQTKNLCCDALHWALIEKFWDDYWAAFRKQSKLEDSEKAEIFVKKLTTGQRALVAVRVLDNMVRVNGWGSVVTNLAFCVDALKCEIRVAYGILGARHYSELMERVVTCYNKRISAIDKLTLEIKKISEKRKQLNIRAGNRAFADDSPKFWELAVKKEKLTDSLIRERQQWREEFITLADSPKTKIERLIEIYVKSHPEEFFRN